MLHTRIDPSKDPLHILPEESIPMPVPSPTRQRLHSTFPSVIGDLVCSARIASTRPRLDKKAVGPVRVLLRQRRGAHVALTGSR
jgi:hypothetical protein